MKKEVRQFIERAHREFGAELLPGLTPDGHHRLQLPNGSTVKVASTPSAGSWRVVTWNELCHKAGFRPSTGKRRKKKRFMLEQQPARPAAATPERNWKRIRELEAALIECDRKISGLECHDTRSAVAKANEWRRLRKAIRDELRLVHGRPI